MAGAADDLYEFNAPKHFFNLNENDDIEVDESYFDCPKSAEVMRELRKPVSSSLAMPMDTPKRPPSSPPANVREILESEDKENTGSNLAENIKSVKHRNSLRRSVPSIGVRQSPRLAAIAKALRRSNAARQSISSGSPKSPDSPQSSQVYKVHKTRTHIKSFVTKVHGIKGLTPDDKNDLEAISSFKQKLVANKKKNNTARPSKVAHSGPTIPQEFHFATDQRLRDQKRVAEAENDHDSATNGPSKPARLGGHTVPKEFNFATESRIKNQLHNEESETVDFPRSLRSNTSTTHNNEAPKGPTIPEPFNLTESRRRKSEDDNQFVSVAELNLKFHTKTPQRFRSKRAGSTDDLNQQGKKTKGSARVTIPHTPKLSTCGRSRQVNYLTREEMEQKAFEEAQQHVFKAHPVNKKVLEAPSSGYQVKKKTATVPEPFNITDSKKDQLPVGFKFQEICDKFGGSASSVASLPHSGVSVKWDKTSTKIQPFSFDCRDKTRQQRKQEMIKKVLEDEKKLADFHAQPMPVFESGVRGVPPKNPPTPTRVQPFKLKSDERGTTKQDQHQRQLEEQTHLESEQRKFRARSSAVLHKNPFVPDKSKKPLTDISKFTLNTEKRAVGRNEYELHRKRKEDEILAAKREQEERQALEEAEEIHRIRQEAVHKANPVRKYKPIVIDHGQHPVTMPKSPNFATESRLRLRSRPNSAMNISSATFMAE